MKSRGRIVQRRTRYVTLWRCDYVYVTEWALFHDLKYLWTHLASYSPPASVSNQCLWRHKFSTGTLRGRFSVAMLAGVDSNPKPSKKSDTRCVVQLLVCITKPSETQTSKGLCSQLISSKKIWLQKKGRKLERKAEWKNCREQESETGRHWKSRSRRKTIGSKRGGGGAIGEKQRKGGVPVSKNKGGGGENIENKGKKKQFGVGW